MKKRKKTKAVLKISLCLVLFAVCFLATPISPLKENTAEPETPAPYSSVLSENIATPRPVLTPAPPTPSPEPVFEEYNITLMALGDMLIHPAVYKTGIQQDGSYNYSFLFEDMSDFLEQADIKIINQETILAGNERGLSGYPRFNSPTEIGDAIAEAGFNVVLHASNHAPDMGTDGLISCAAFWKNHPEVLMTGIHEEETYGDIPLLNVKDVTFAVLNYTYGPNAQVINSSLQGHLDMLCDYNRQTGAINFTALNPQVIEDIQAARELADVVIVCPHWGTEYQTTPSKYQQKFAQEIADAGADLIIGTHPHVPQPAEWLTAEDGRNVLCFYSLGNYVSTQNRKQTMLEAMAWVTFHVTKDGVAIAEHPTGMLPLVCHYKKNTLRHQNVYLLEDYTEELAVSHGITYYEGVETLHLSELQEQCGATFGNMRLYRKDILP